MPDPDRLAVRDCITTAHRALPREADKARDALTRALEILHDGTAWTELKSAPTGVYLVEQIEGGTHMRRLGAANALPDPQLRAAIERHRSAFEQAAEAIAAEVQASVCEVRDNGVPVGYKAMRPATTKIADAFINALENAINLKK